MKVALVHDYLREYGGAEKVLEALNQVWKDAPIYTTSYEHDLMDRLGFKVPAGLIHPLFTQYFPWRQALRKHYAPIYPFAFKYLKIQADVIISSSSYAAKFVSKPKEGLHICYLHSIPKFLWGYETETPNLETLPIDKYLKPVYKAISPQVKRILRKMDFDAAQKVDFFIANSSFTKERIKRHYDRDSVVIYPPVEVEKFKGTSKDEGYFLVISRLGSFKKVDIVVKTFNEFKKPLKIIGEGQDLDKLKRLSLSNIEFLGAVPETKLTETLKNCTAVVFPTEEDFGIVPVEAMAAGKPVIAFRGGGSLETVVEGKTGEFFDKQEAGSLLEVLKKFDPARYNARDCTGQAEKFSKEEFKKKIKFFVEESWANRSGG